MTLVLDRSSGEIHHNNTRIRVISKAIQHQTEVTSLFRMMLVFHRAKNALIGEVECT